MATAVSVTLTGPSGAAIYGGQFAPGNLSGSAALDGVSASGTMGSAAAPTTATLSVSSGSAITGGSVTVTVMLNAAADQTYVATLSENGADTSLSGSTVTITAGGTSGSRTLTNVAAAETVTVTLVSVSPSLTIAGSPRTVTFSAAPADWLTRSSASTVVWRHRFDSDNEISKFITGATTPGVAHAGAAIMPFRVADPTVGNAMRFIVLGGKLAANFPASGGAGPRALVIEDDYLWPDPATAGNYYVMLVKPTPDQANNLLLVTAKSGKTLTVTYQAGGGQPLAGVQRDWVVGDLIGAQCGANWTRIFSALKAGDNGLGADDINNAAVTLRDRTDTTNFPHGLQAFGYGWYGHADMQAAYPSWRPSDYPYGLPIDSTLRTGVWDGDEFEFTYRQRVDPSYLTIAGAIDPNSEDNRFGGKVMMLQAEMTVPQQITAGYSPSNRYGIPTTLEPPFGLAAYNFGGGLAGRRLTSNIDGTGSIQPGSSWASTALQSSFMAAGSAWENPAGEWVCFKVRCKPGHPWHQRVGLVTAAFDTASSTTMALAADPAEWPSSGTVTIKDDSTSETAVVSYSGRSGATLTGCAYVSGVSKVYPITGNGSSVWDSVTARAGVMDTLVEVKVCREGDSTWTTVFSKSDQAIAYGSSGPVEHTWTSALPGYSAFSLTAYRNLELGSAPPQRSYYFDFAEVIFAKRTTGSTELAPPAATLPSYVPAAGRVATITTGGGVLTNTFASQVASHYNAFYSKKIRNDYSGAAVNPYYGTAGAVHCEGGGHAATNDNSVINVEFAASTIAFRRMLTGTNWFPGAPVNNDVGNISGLYDTTWADANADGKPLSRHSYGDQVVIGPEYGGAANGTFRFSFSNGSYGGFIPALGHSPHKLPITSTSSEPTWARACSAPEAWADANSPLFSAHVPRQRRVYVHKAHVVSIHWQNLLDESFGVGSGTPLSDDTDSPGGGAGLNGGRLFAVPDRNLLLFADRKGGNLRIRYMSVGLTDTDPSWVNGAANAGVTISAAIPVGYDWSQICWVPDARVLVVGNVSGDAGCVYEIAIPDTLSSTWTATRRAFTGGDAVSWTGGNGYGAFDYSHKLRSIPYFPAAVDSGNDSLFLYRPTGT